ncbi:hypothetical protein DH2020_006994 [Rehmannia glutinosa]|uniref:Uncharacterized protein n=1 Tax=Rehmannia glutinosa TaxID=99300 RepID=A0ABR0W683_REHGL
MGSFSGLGIGLSFVFGCILMGLVAELYYLLYWKNRIEGFCFQKKNPISSQEQGDLEMGSSKDLGLIKGYGEEGIETELMRAHNLCGPPRFLFTIKEEDFDLESEDGKSRTNLSLSPNNSNFFYHNNNNHHGFNNPLFETLSEAEVNRLRSSPPPKFKFLKDAEDKLIRRLLVEEAEKKKGLKNVQDSENSRNGSQEEKDVCFLKLSQHEAEQVVPLSSSSSPILKPQEQ